ncbi:MAG: dihydropteroate synthase [Gemmatimonadales bacterium]
MIVTPLAIHSPRAVRDTLLAHGWDSTRAGTASAGLGPLAVRFDGVTAEVLEALVRQAGKLGLDVITGDDWAILAGSFARLGALARPWVQPPELADLCYRLGLALPPDAVTEWVTARGTVSLSAPVLIGILNVTPDSFSDGGRFVAPEAALAQAERLLEDGAGILDIGGESTRPAARQPVTEAEELARVLPLIEALVSRHPSVLLSVDTVKSAVARAALEAGAAIVNDVSGFRLDPSMAGVVATAGSGVVLMHSRGPLSEISSEVHADYAGDVTAAVVTELGAAVERATRAGVAAQRIVVDPGFGFGKTAAQSLVLLDGLAALRSLGRPVLVGPSRKRFLGEATGRDVAERDVATAAACVVAYERGARLFRVHAVAVARDALAVAHATREGPEA